MENPEYIVLVALDTPSRATGIYISGGVMAAPTVGAVMADILPYLGVERHFSEEEAAGRTVTVPDLTGLAAQEAQHILKDLGLTASFSGAEETVTGQIPQPGALIPGDSQMLVYLGEDIPERMAQVPDFSGMNRQQASDEAGKLGLYILVTGNQEVSTRVVATAQSIPAGEMAPAGTTIQLEFTDTGARD